VGVADVIPGWRVEEMPRGDRASWMSLRQHDLCASEAGALFDAHKYTTMRRIFQAKAYGEVEYDSTVMRRGRIMEPAVAEAITVDVGLATVRCNTYLRARADDPLVRMGASRDFMLLEAAMSTLLEHPKTRATCTAAGWDALAGQVVSLPVEGKSVDPWVYDNEWANGPPVYIVVQGAMQALLCDAPGAIVACLLENRSRDLYLYAIPRVPAFELRLVDEVRKFWAAFEAGDEPPVVALDNGFMADYFPKVDESEVINLTEEAAAWEALAAERESLTLQGKNIEKRIDKIEALFKDKMRESTKAILPGWSCTWSADKNGKRSFRLQRASASSKPRKK
jgi:predicted phage-related endonuclease